MAGVDLDKKFEPNFCNPNWICRIIHPLAAIPSTTETLSFHHQIPRMSKILKTLSVDPYNIAGVFWNENNSFAVKDKTITRTD